MKKYYPALSAMLLTVWVGALWAVGYLAVPVIFHAQPDRQLAGMLAGELLHRSGMVGLICGSLLLLLECACGTLATCWRHTNFRLIGTMLLLAAIIQFGLSPLMAELKAQALPLDVMHSTSAAQFSSLHGLSSVLYLLESLLGGYLVWRTAATNRKP